MHKVYLATNDDVAYVVDAHMWDLEMLVLSISYTRGEEFPGELFFHEAHPSQKISLSYVNWTIPLYTKLVYLYK
jgi:hypothetical protein